jgi:hypothetical protein
MVNFFIKTGGGNGVSGPLYIDDIYLEDSNAINLENPIGPSSSVHEAEIAPGFELVVIYPTALQPEPTIRFRLPEPSVVDLAVFDARGRRIADLISTHLEARQYDVTWSGRDWAGQPVGAGVYFIRLIAGDLMATDRLVLLK